MATNIHKKVITLEEISSRKKEVQRQIKEQQQLMQSTAAGLFAPVTAANKVELFMNSVNSGMAMFDGVMTGIKVVRRVRGFFKRKRRTGVA